jgi:hypothetical protein
VWLSESVPWIELPTKVILNKWAQHITYKETITKFISPVQDTQQKEKEKLRIMIKYPVKAVKTKNISVISMMIGPTAPRATLATSR